MVEQNQPIRDENCERTIFKMAAATRGNEWSSEMEAFFISEVEKRRNIWDIRDTLYSKKVFKRAKYEEISKELIEKWPEKANLFNVDMLLKKFSNLKTYYRRERKKYILRKSGSEGIGFQPRWEHFSRLGFLSESCIAEESLSNISIVESTLSEENIQTPEDLCLTAENTESASVLKETFSSWTPKSNKKRKRQEAITELTSCLKNLNDTQEDAEEAFGHYIAVELKSMEESKRDLAKLRIQALMYELKYDT